MSQAKATAGDVLVTAVTPFAPRLAGKGFSCERQDAATRTVRYVVKATADDGIIGQIVWDGHGKEYLLEVTQPRRFQAHWLAELVEILRYLTTHQRRQAATARRAEP